MRAGRNPASDDASERELNFPWVEAGEAEFVQETHEARWQAMDVVGVVHFEMHVRRGESHGREMSDGGTRGKMEDRRPFRGRRLDGFKVGQPVDDAEGERTAHVTTHQWTASIV